MITCETCEYCYDEVDGKTYCARYDGWEPVQDIYAFNVLLDQKRLPEKSCAIYGKETDKTVIKFFGMDISESSLHSMLGDGYHLTNYSPGRLAIFADDSNGGGGWGKVEGPLAEKLGEKHNKWNWDVHQEIKKHNGLRYYELDSDGNKKKDIVIDVEERNRRNERYAKKFHEAVLAEIRRI